MSLNLPRTVATVLVAFVASTCLAQTSSPQYGVKASAAPIGSNIKRYVTQGSEIPINRTYAELSPEEKASVNLYYENMEPGDEPPFPLEGLAPIHRALATLQSRLAGKGKLVLVATVAEDGSVTEVKAIGSPSPEITMAAANIIVVSKFKPAVCKGQPCRMDFPFSFVFALQ